MKRLIACLVLLWTTSAFCSTACWFSQSNPRNNGVSYNAVLGNYTDPSSVYDRPGMIAPGGGTISKVYVWVANAPGSGKKWEIQVRVDDATDPNKVTIQDTATSASLAIAKKFNAGQNVVLYVTPTSLPTATTMYFCIDYAPTATNHTYTMSDYSNCTTYAIAPAGNCVANNNDRIIFPCAGTVYAFYARLTADTGTSGTRVLTVQKNGASTWEGHATAMTVIFDNTGQVKGTTSNSFTVAAGDTLRIVPSYTGTPTASYVGTAIDFVPDAPYTDHFPVFSYHTNIGMTTGTSGYLFLWNGNSGSSATAISDYVRQLVIKRMEVLLSSSPGSGNTYDITVNEDGSASAATVHIADLGTTGNVEPTGGVTIEEGHYMDLYVALSTSATGRSVFTGTLLTTVTETAPAKASGADPANNATEISVRVDPTWTDQEDATSYDVYFGTESAAVTAATNASAEFIGNQANPPYDRSVALSPNTDYYWRIDTKGATLTTKGDTWKFTTATNENDFSTDGECFAVWAFNTVGNLGDDSKGTADLTNVTDHLAVSTNTTKREGATAADFDGLTPAYMTISDATWVLKGGPLNSSDATRDISIAFWFYPETVPSSPSYAYLFSKWDEANSKESLALAITEVSGGRYVMARIATLSSGVMARTNLGVHVTAGNWYHVGFTYDDTDRSYALAVYDSVTDSTSTMTGTLPDNVAVTDAAIYLGAPSDVSGSYFDGVLDAVVVFKDILTNEEIRQIRNFTYKGPSTGGGGGSIFRSVVQ
jgi:hypothetical protein